MDSNSMNWIDANPSMGPGVLMQISSNEAEARYLSDIKCRRLRIFSQAIKDDYRSLNLSDLIADYAFGTLRELYRPYENFWDQRDAWVAACIFIACRSYGRTMRYQSILDVANVSFGDGLGILLTLETNFFERPGYLYMMPEVYSPTLGLHQPPDAAGKGIWKTPAGRIVVASTYDTKAPRLRDFCCQKLPIPVAVDKHEKTVKVNKDIASVESEKTIKNLQQPTVGDDSEVVINTAQPKASNNPTTVDIATPTDVIEDSDWDFIQHEDATAVQISIERNDIVPQEPTKTWAGALRRGIFR